MAVLRRQSLGYRLYMRSTLWAFRRWLWYVTSSRRCEVCKRALVLHRRDLPLHPGAAVLTVHHRTYRRLGRERRADVELLCWSCHCRRQPWKRAA